MEKGIVPFDIRSGGTPQAGMVRGFLVEYLYEYNNSYG
jgi:hypothetical protein